MDVLRRFGMPAALAVAFAAHAGMTGVMAGRTPADALCLALSLGALIVSLIAAGGPLAAVRALDGVAARQAAAGGILTVLVAPAMVAANRMTDAPSGSVTVWWMSAGWAALAAIGAAALMWRRRRADSIGALAGVLAVVAGAAGVLANWERPSSFSPLVKYPLQEFGMLLGGAALVCGGLLLVAASRRGGRAGALVVGTAAASAGALGWFAVSNVASGLRALVEQPLTLAVAALAWGFVVLTWTSVLRDEGPAAGAACLALAPLLLSALTLIEQVVGAAGPQPLVFEGVLAGSLLLLAGVLRLIRAGVAVPEERPLPGLAKALLATPVLPAVVGLVLPALRVDVTAARPEGAFAASWTLAGAESVAGWSALALAFLLISAAGDPRSKWPVIAALAACAAWPALLSVPTHVLNRWLSPEVQQYYGTEYATLEFTVVRNYPLLLAAAASAAGLLYMVFVRSGRGAVSATRSLRETEGS